MGKIKSQNQLYKSCFTSVKDIDEKGTVVFHGSIFGTADRVKDIVVPGAYKKTISENFKQIQHYKNHDSTLMPGVFKELGEDSTGLLANSKLILGTQLGRETYEEYKAMAEAGKSMSHSIGYYPVKEEPDGKGFNLLKEVALFEISTLTKRPAHPDALTVGIKSFEDMDIEQLVIEEQFYKNLLNCSFKDVKLEKLEGLKNHINALIIEKSRAITQEDNEPQVSKSEILKMLKNL